MDRKILLSQILKPEDHDDEDFHNHDDHHEEDLDNVDQEILHGPKKLFISQPMANRTPEEIRVERDSALVYAEYTTSDNYEEIDSYFGDKEGSDLEGDRQGLFLLGKSLQLLATADAAYFCEDWYKARGCQIEHECCEKYHIPILYD